jgi:LuxR family quorum-sensing system transcriptional regulator SolR
MDAWLETQIQTLLNASTEEALSAALFHAAKDLGFEYCAYGIRVPVPVTKPKLFTTNNYPKAWQQRYREANYISIDPTVVHGMHSITPLVWSDETFAGCPALWEEARSHGLRVGWAQACYNANAVGGLLTLARSHDDLSPHEVQERSPKMSWLVYAAHETFCRLLISRIAPDAAVALSPREIEVLRWTADGKTSGEIGDIISISERTVNFHVNNAIAKLRTGNKTAATIKAALLGLL